MAFPANLFQICLEIVWTWKKCICYRTSIKVEKLFEYKNANFKDLSVHLPGVVNKKIIFRDPKYVESKSSKLFLCFDVMSS